MFSNLKAICTMERVKSTPSFKFIDRKHLKWLIGPSSDYDVLVAIVSRVSVTRTELLRLGGKANSDETAILGFLLKLFTRNMGDPPYTSTRRSPKSIVQHVTVDSPQFSLLGASTPEGFYEALQAGNLDDGFMNRLIVVEAAPRTSNNAVRAADVPGSVRDALQAIVLVGREGDPLARALRPAERMVPWASGAVEIEWRRLRDQVHVVIDAVPTKEGSLYGRIAEQTVRFAARHALSRDGASAAVDMVDLEWGAAFVRQSVRALRDGAAAMMAGSEFERNVNTVLALVQKRGTIMLSELTREIRIEPYKRDAALGHLQTAHQIEISPAPSGPGGGRPSRLIRCIGD
jgi:hypothetical protein